MKSLISSGESFTGVGSSFLGELESFCVGLVVKGLGFLKGIALMKTCPHLMQELPSAECFGILIPQSGHSPLL